MSVTCASVLFLVSCLLLVINNSNNNNDNNVDISNPQYHVTVITRVQHAWTISTLSTDWRCVFSAVLNDLTVSHARMCIGSWFQALGPATANARVSKCVTEEETTRSPRVADRSLCLLPTVVTG